LVVDPEKIRSLVELMAEHELAEVSIRSGDEEIVLKRGVPGGHSVTYGHSMPAMHMPMHAPSSAPSAAAPPAAASPPVDADAGLVAIKSPMVGTFYASPDPNSPNFVSEGSKVRDNTVVCIVEAMKVFNEIKADVSGTIVKVLTRNEAPVEYGQPLFMVRPD
jgi:acetyl-CoA carboxylase biotin carboxyl carrier protein